MTSATNAADVRSTTAPPPWSLFAPSGANGRGGNASSSSEAASNNNKPVTQFSDVLNDRTQPRTTAQAETTRPSEPGRTAQYAGLPPNIKAEDRWEYQDRQDTTALASQNSDDFFGEDGFSLADIVDIVNPLQHLPVISTIYRSLTGDEISTGARLAGDALFGGPVGFAAGLANVVMEDATGSDIGDSVMAALFGSEDDAGTALASADSPAAMADDVAEIAPASGTTQQAAPVQMAQAAPTARTRASSPLFAAQPTGMPLASNPGAATSLIPPMPGGPPTVLAQAASQPTRSSQAGQTPQTPMTAAGQGVPKLSPDAANVLMRMAQASQSQIGQSQAGQSQAGQSQASRSPSGITPSGITPSGITPPVGPTAMAAPSDAAPSKVAAPASTASGKAAPVQTASAEFVEPVPVENLPAAMMEALSRYEALKGG
ncbi:hypothetical protein HH303_11070 [Rhodospirillaceae bacterium KN72]|uniref:Uncharacterized protein n=1 Tax=Pacificispira spongiicola TaxID=2729598 RepID=A0A7Y0HEM5_9PROT|nr:hypothetical protein [Pacificispira spongiicola]NMM45021.1 hypothetical protein [Pacificispira spongiicola]